MLNREYEEKRTKAKVTLLLVCTLLRCRCQSQCEDGFDILIISCDFIFIKEINPLIFEAHFLNLLFHIENCHRIKKSTPD